MASMPPPVQNFVACLLLRQLLPLAPLFVAYIYEGTITAKAITLTASMYAVSQGVASKNLAVFSINLVTGLLTAAAYGAVDPASKALPLYKSVPFLTIVATIIMHAFERYYRHIVDHEPFFSFKIKKDGEGKWI
jgi:hypothetical protein